MRECSVGTQEKDCFHHTHTEKKPQSVSECFPSPHMKQGFHVTIGWKYLARKTEAFWYDGRK